MEAMATISESVLRAAQKINRLLTRGAKAHDLSARQVEILIILAEEPGLSQAEMMERCSMDRSTMSFVMKSMEEKNLVTRVRSKEDIRAFEVTLTQKGSHLVAEAKKVRRDVEKTLTKAVLEPRNTTADLDAIADLVIGDEK